MLQRAQTERELGQTHLRGVETSANCIGGSSTVDGPGVWVHHTKGAERVISTVSRVMANW